MNYKFPVIKYISDVLYAISGRDEFVVVDKGKYTIINYNVMMADTFPVIEEPFPMAAAIRRECRGISFCSKTGKILRRPLHKFFNVNEREETQLHELDFSKEHWIDTKVDGSMIAPFIVDNEIVWGTKMAAQDFHELVHAHVTGPEAEGNYLNFTRELIEAGYTPIFEFVSRKKRIVVDYPEDDLILLAVRKMDTGEFVPLEKTCATDYGIPTVEQHGSVKEPKGFLEYVRGLSGAEGFVVRWADGHRVKIKADEYVQIHKAKEAILQDRNIVELILDEKLDDVKAHLPAEERDRLTQFENDFNKVIHPLALSIVVQVSNCQRLDGMDRKTFALNYAPKMDQFSRPIAFAIWNEVQYVDAVSVCEKKIRDTIRNNLGRTSKYEAIRDVWFPGVVYND